MSAPYNTNAKRILDRPLPDGHSCHYCQKLILDYSAEAFRWRKDPLAPIDESQQENVSWKPPPRRVLKWVETVAEFLDEQLSLEFIIFDLTVGEVRVAAANGCSLCHTLLSNWDIFNVQPALLGNDVSFPTDNELLITGVVFGSIVHFSVIRPIEEMIRLIEGSTGRFDYFNYQLVGRNRFRVTTTTGKLYHSSNRRIREIDQYSRC